jgi:hypothetical protein
LNRHKHFFLVIFLGLILPATMPAKLKNKHPKQESPQDQIQVVAHLALTGRVNHFLMTKHYSRDYLYIEYEAGKTVALIDTTNPEHPAVLADVAYPPNTNSDALLTVTGNAALVMDGPAPSQGFNPCRTIRIMSFADPAHPTVQKEFQKVSAMAHDDRRGLIFLANAEGLWILQQHFAIDPVAEAQWEHDVLGNR